MERHVTILGALHIALGTISLVIALGPLLVQLLVGRGVEELISLGVAGFSSRGAASDPDALITVPNIVGILGTLVTILRLIALIVSLPAIAAGFGLMAYRPWARMLTVVLSLLHLFNFPFGSVLGVYGLWVLLSNETRVLFEQRAAVG